MADWYDHPQYFDMVFRDETPAEVAFFQLAFAKYARGRVKKLLEPGCGSGRLVAAMAALDYELTGLDLSPAMLAYLRRRLHRRKLPARLVQGDMTRMDLDETYDSAFCTFNTFRHLLTESDAVAHLRSVATHVRRGGIYILGFHIIPLDADPESTERWTAQHGGTKVHVTLKVIGFDRSRRQETLRAIVTAKLASGGREQIRSEFPLRLYTDRQVRSLFKKVSDAWEVAGIHDFDYAIDVPRELDNDLTDAVFVLRRL